MNCDDFRERLQASLDGELSAESESELSDHLRDCGQCANDAGTLRELHHRLRNIAPDEAALERITQGVMQQWNTGRAAVTASVPAAHAKCSTSRVWKGLLATALLVLVGVFVLQQQEDVDPVDDHLPVANQGGDDPILPILATDSRQVASVVQMTGTVEVKYLDRDDWLPVSITPFACPSDAAVRTGDDSLCEMETSAGGIVRLDEHATVRMRSADQIELETGRVWCKAPGEGTLQLTPALGEMPVPETVDFATCLSAPIMSCQANCSAQAELTDATDFQVHALEGLVDVASEPFGAQLNSGEAVQIVAGRVDREYEEDALLAIRWMLPLVANHAGEVEAFTQRVLASVGGAKVGFLYEADLLQLGEPGAVPLLAFLQTTAPLDRVEARRAAARVLSQTASAEMADDLIDLLSDSDPEVRVSIASALLRITGEDQGRTPEEWGTDLSESQEALSAWQAWRDR